MATQGNRVKFVFVRTGLRPVDPDPDTIYFVPGSKSIYVGDEPIVSTLEVEQDINQLTQDVNRLENEQIRVDITGEGSYVTDAQFDTETHQLTLTKGEGDAGSRWDVVG